MNDIKYICDYFKIKYECCEDEENTFLVVFNSWIASDKDGFDVDLGYGDTLLEQMLENLRIYKLI